MYKQALSTTENILIVKRSKFITTVTPIESAEDAENKLAIISKKYSDATHNCYAYIANDIATAMRASDDGEPQGTAGIPILEVLKRRGVYKTLVVVTRYFGGILLGAAGLVSAYTDSASSALDAADIKEFLFSARLTIGVSYNACKVANETIANFGGRIIDTAYTDSVVITCDIPMDGAEEFRAKLIDSLSGNANIEQVASGYFAY